MKVQAGFIEQQHVIRCFVLLNLIEPDDERKKPIEPLAPRCQRQTHGVLLVFYANIEDIMPRTGNLLPIQLESHPELGIRFPIIEKFIGDEVAGRLQLRDVTLEIGC